MLFIYVLQLEKNKYYVGKTSNPKFRLENHFTNNGSEWTKLYKPIKLLELIPNCDNYDEDKYTIKYMDKYGIDNVRGGTYSSIKLNDITKKQLVKISNSTNNRCFICSKYGHFAKECNYKHESDDSDESDDSYIVWCCEYCDKEFETEQKCEYHQKSCKSKYKNKYKWNYDYY